MLRSDWNVLSCEFLSCVVLCCLVLCCLVLSCLVVSCLCCVLILRLDYGGPGEMGMGMRMRMRIRMRMRACIAQTCTLLSESALPFHMLRTYPYDAGVLAFGLAFVFVFVLSRIMRVFGLA